jgi:hypothetical protein
LSVFRRQAALDVGENFAAVGGGLPGRQVNGPLKALRLYRSIKRQRMGAAVHDDQRLFVVAQGGHEVVVGHFTGKFQFEAPEHGMQPVRIGRQFTFRADLETPGKIGQAQSRLGRGAEHDGTAVIQGQFVKCCDARAQNRQRDGLRLVEDDHGIGEIMQLAAPRRTVDETRDLGFMLWDIDHAGDRSSLFFRAGLDNGVVKIPPPASPEIRR